MGKEQTCQGSCKLVGSKEQTIFYLLSSFSSLLPQP